MKDLEIVKKRIIDTINKDGKNLEELKDIMDWSKRIIDEYIDLKNESELNALENQTYEG